MEDVTYRYPRMTSRGDDHQARKIDGVDFESDPEENMVHYTDKSGKVLSFRKFHGINVSIFFPLRVLNQVKDFKFRPDDVYLPGFPRTGTNWTHEMAQMLLYGKAETIQGVKPHLDIFPAEEIDKRPSPRIVNAHIPMSEAPDDIKIKKTKVIFTLRDPRDVIVSLWNIHTGFTWTKDYYDGAFEDYLYLFLDGKVDWNGIFEHWRNAEKFFDENPDIPVHFQVYEETIQNPLRSVQKLSDFLGLSREDELCQAIADKCVFKKMKVDKDPYTLKVKGVDTLYRKGTSGDWKNYFSDEMLDDYYRVYDEQMAGSRFYNLYSRKAETK